MSRSLASFLMAAATVILLAVLALLVAVPPLVDWNRQRAPLETLLSRALGEEVLLEGDISLRLLPVPRLQAEEMSVGTDIRIAALRLEADWLALLGGGLQAGKAHARGLEAHLLRRPEEGWRLPARLLAIGSIDITEGKVFLQDEILGIRQEISLAEAHIQGGADLFQSGRISVRLDTPDSPLGDALELRLALQSAAGDATDMSLHASFAHAEMRFQGRWQAQRLHGTMEAHRIDTADQGVAGDSPSYEQEVNLRADVTIDAEQARFQELALQWGATHWRGDGIVAFSGRPQLDFSLETSGFEASDAVALLQTLSSLQTETAIWDSLDGRLALQAESLLWQGVSLGAGALSAQLDADALALDITLEDLRGGGHVRWQARKQRQDDGFAPLVGKASMDVRRPDFLLGDFPSSVRAPVRLEGMFSWLPEGRFALDAGALMLAGERLGALETRLRLVRQDAQRGVVLEGMRLQEGDDLLLDADGVLLWEKERAQGMEGRINARLYLSAAAAHERFPAFPAGALFPPDADLSLQGEWLFAPSAPDSLSITGTLGAANVRITAEGPARLLQESRSSAGGEMTPVQISWRRPDGFVELNGVLSRQVDFFRGALRAEGDDMRRLFSFWLPSLGNRLDGAGEGWRLPFTLRAALTAGADGRDRHLAWQGMEFSWPVGENGKRLLLRGDGRITDGFGTQPPRLQARLDGDGLVLAGWEFLSLLEGAGEPAATWMPGLDVAAAIKSVRIGDLPLRQVTLRLSGEGGGLDAISARGELFGGTGHVRANPSAAWRRSSSAPSVRGELPRWQLNLHGARLERASRFLWGEETARGTMDFSLEATGDIRRVQTLSGLGTVHLADGMICCIDIAGLREQARTGGVEIEAFARPQSGRDVWTEFGTGAFAVGLESGVLALRGQGGLGESSILAAELDVQAITLRLLAEFSVPVGAEEREAALGYVVEGEVLRPRVSFDASALEQALEGLRLQRALQELEGGSGSPDS